MIKAYYLSIKDGEDAGCAIVFAETSRAAKSKIYGTTLGDSVEEWIDIRVNRAKEYDGMESLTQAQLAKEQWRNGWEWFDMDYPNVEEATDQEFYEWYDKMFGTYRNER